MTKTSKKQKNLANPVELPEVQVIKPYAVGDTMHYADKSVKVVEVLDDKIHVKNQQEPFDSFFINLSRSVDDNAWAAMPSVGLEVIEDYNAPDLMVREDKSISL